MVWRSARRGVRGADVYRRTNRRADQTSVPASETTVVTALTAGRSKRAVVEGAAVRCQAREVFFLGLPALV